MPSEDYQLGLEKRAKERAEYFQLFANLGNGQALYRILCICLWGYTQSDGSLSLDAYSRLSIVYFETGQKQSSLELIQRLVEQVNDLVENKGRLEFR